MFCGHATSIPYIVRIAVNQHDIVRFLLSRFYFSPFIFLCAPISPSFMHLVLCWLCSALIMHKKTSLLILFSLLYRCLKRMPISASCHIYNSCSILSPIISNFLVNVQSLFCQVQWFRCATTSIASPWLFFNICRHEIVCRLFSCAGSYICLVSNLVAKAPC